MKSLQPVSELLHDLDQKTDGIVAELGNLSSLQKTMSELEKKAAYLESEINRLTETRTEIGELIEEMETAQEGGREILEASKVSLTHLSGQVDAYKSFYDAFELQKDLVVRFEKSVTEAGKVLLRLESARNEVLFLSDSLQRMVEENEKRNREVEEKVERIQWEMESSKDREEQKTRLWRRLLRLLGGGDDA